MIDEELIRQTAKDLKINISPQEIEETLELIALKEKKNPDQLKIIFRENNLSLLSYIKQIEAELLWNKIINQHLRNNIKINDAEIIEFLPTFMKRCQLRLDHYFATGQLLLTKESLD